ncbi:type VI secretion system protein TssL, long form [Paracoccaceae bacterium GXU_MW_L88]
MSDSSDPLGEGPRIVLPNPGGEPAPSQPASQPKTDFHTPGEAPFSAESVMRGFRLSGADFPVMVSEATGLLNLAYGLRHRKTPPDLEALRRDVIAAIRDYERKLVAAGILPEQARAAHYVVCATLDDVIRNMPWGEGWSSRGLVSTFHHDVTGGDKVFDLITHFQAQPGANRDLLLLIYLCLSLGFEGRTRVSARGALELAQVRDNLYRTLRQQYGDQERDLSPLWKGESARHQPLRRGRLFWLLSGLLILLLAGMFLAFSLFLNQSADGALNSMASLPPDETPSLFIPEPEPEIIEEPPVEEPVVEEPVEPEINPIDSLIAFLEPEVEEGLVRLYRDGDAVLVRVANAGAFEPGGAQIAPEFLDIFERIGMALAAEDFDVSVIGHTDNNPIRTDAFPSNFHLSTARAAAVRDILLNYISPDRVEIRGEADLRPIADNDTAEGREQNRRTEILVRAAGARVSPELLQQGGELSAPVDAPPLPENETATEEAAQ